tara:strand:- start:2397 stop:2654 length:258 start_codon:yes stop_codon:yes gene_type:complete
MRIDVHGGGDAWEVEARIVPNWGEYDSVLVELPPQLGEGPDTDHNLEVFVRLRDNGWTVTIYKDGWASQDFTYAELIDLLTEEPS